MQIGLTMRLILANEMWTELMLFFGWVKTIKDQYTSLSLFSPTVLTLDARCFRWHSYRMQEGHRPNFIWTRDNPIQITQVRKLFENDSYYYWWCSNDKKQVMLSLISQLVGVNSQLVWLGSTLFKEQGFSFKSYFSCTGCLR